MEPSSPKSRNLTERCKPSAGKGSIVDKLAMPEAAAIDFDLSRVHVGLKPADPDPLINDTRRD